MSRPFTEHTSSWRSPSMMVLLAAALLLFIAWAASFEIDQGVRASGQIISSARTQIIQTVDGGVLSELRVVEGQQVKVGEVLAVLEKSRAEAGFEESRDKVASLTIAMTRARAEARLQAPAFGPEFKGYPEFVAAQQALYQQKKRTLEEDLKAGSQSLSMAREELHMTEALLKDGDVSQLEALRARRQVTELEGRLAASRNKYRQEASAEAAKIEEDLASVNAKLAERRDVLGHTELSAPVAGVIKYLKVTTIGGVLRGGDELMQIAPTDDDLIIEAKINPSDVGQLRVGLPVSVKLDAFDYSVYGMLHGELVYISPDTLSEVGQSGQSQTYYRAKIHLPHSQGNNPKARDIVVKPGMTVSVDIRTGTRSVLNYMAKPIFKAFGGALIER
ncbi:secretion protein [Rhodoferax lacus]|uniref:Secretion protein n=1 Tax=Rhodoferax lacus TaxID=2184758 RepID=A0A3E1RCE0_9BURK|nr:HlyD family efflux transporter periplasmic adaptor subunit [Rhodoferax lacus]RFO96300.1 secretion protein [Rhodoferax lacus]